jgi:hypothetical protein
MSVIGEKSVLNKTSLSLERVFGFVCLLIFQVRVTPGFFFARMATTFCLMVNNQQNITDRLVKFQTHRNRWRTPMDKAAKIFWQPAARPIALGNESAHQRIWLDYVKRFAQVDTDHSGTAIGMLNPEAEFRVLLAGHSDEIAMMVKRIDERGFIYFTNAGGIKSALLPGLKVDILGYGGKIGGVIGFNRKSIQTAPSKPSCVDTLSTAGFSNKKKSKRLRASRPFILFRANRNIQQRQLVCKGPLTTNRLIHRR